MTVDTGLTSANVTLASGGAVVVQKDGNRVVVTLDLEVADALVIRP